MRRGIIMMNMMEMCMFGMCMLCRAQFQQLSDHRSPTER